MSTSFLRVLLFNLFRLFLEKTSFYRLHECSLWSTFFRFELVMFRILFSPVLPREVDRSFSLLPMWSLRRFLVSLFVSFSNSFFPQFQVFPDVPWQLNAPLSLALFDEYFSFLWRLPPWSNGFLIIDEGLVSTCSLTSWRFVLPHDPLYPLAAFLSPYEPFLQCVKLFFSVYVFSLLSCY